MVWEELKTSLIVTDMEAGSSREVFEQLGGLLTKEGYTKETYVKALIDREKDYPTGLDIDGVGVAIPHTDVSHVNKAATAIATLKNPVDWVEMGTDDDPVKVRLVFMLSVDDPQAHINQLQQIVGIIQDKEVMNQIIDEKNPEKIIEIIKEKEDTM
ncbi:MAG: PTS sugar transporter subunit IIA [Oscillospiraceae bacterium]|nr:PTS sugar transporter subunit IIA [Oscillospiraceae bacterium]